MSSTDIQNTEEVDLKISFLRYFRFWPLFLITTLIISSSSYIYLRYAEYNFQSSANIQIIDKQNSDMALPTAMTLFNSSMINLENEIGVLSSYSLHERVVKRLNSNVKYYTQGSIKKYQEHKSTWLDDYDISFNINLDEVQNHNTYDLKFDEGKLSVSVYDNEDELLKEYSFNNMSTLSVVHELPFDITVNKHNSKLYSIGKIIEIFPITDVVESRIESVTYRQSGEDSDQLLVFMNHPNSIVCREYINTLINEFDKDGISDRQMEYLNTIKFVDSRSAILTTELAKIELIKQEFKENNNLSSIESEAKATSQQKFSYNSDLFKAKSQKDLAILLSQALEKNNFDYMPLNIGLENNTINIYISEYNVLIRQRNKFLLSAGKNNVLIKNLDKEVNDISLSIGQSVDNYIKSLDVTIQNLETKEQEFNQIYFSLPQNEKILRSINRELEVKEALFILLLQKREEASINYAVVKPSIKIIDNARSSGVPIDPKPRNFIIASLLFSFLLPFMGLKLHFIFDTKIHTKDQLTNLLDDIPILAEIPFLENEDELKSITSTDTRNTLAESIRMLVANINFVLFDKTKVNNNVILVTSSTKAEGKTLISVNVSSLLSSTSNRVLLIGSDLRNPQIHKFLNEPQKTIGLSDYIHRDDIELKSIIKSHNNLDIILSGIIPPNPTEILASDKFKNLLDKFKKEYDYVVIDSAPCLLVSDTYVISKYAGLTLYVVRSNHTEKEIAEFINENKNGNKLHNINIVLNGVGSSGSYGYKYGYKYNYNYGYSYGYGTDKD